MHPVLFEGPLGWTANSYGTLTLLGIIAAVPGITWDARKRGLGLIFVLDVFVFAIVGSILGGEILHLITRADRYAAMPSLMETGDVFGLVYYGSIIGMFAAMVWVARKHGRPAAEVIGIVLTWGEMTHFFGRIGCHLAGCCWGAATDSAWAVHFPEGAVVYADPTVAHEGARTIGLHPVQLYEAAGLLALVVVLAAIRLRKGPQTRWSDQPARWAIGYGMLRLVTEVFRADPDRRQLLTIEWPALSESLALPAAHPVLLSTSQAISLVLIAGGIVLVWRARAR
jgi:phosphatidylglycerol:prolipoprotein diacylglycerol transferase